mgnify:CR=1 FL=1
MSSISHGGPESNNSEHEAGRHPNQIPLDSPATGNATTTPGGAIYSARNFQIAHAGYRLVRKDLWLDLQASRNLGAGRLRDALMASVNLGAVHGFGDMRFLYQFAIKDANAIVSQFTDDDLGTGSGVNIAVHAVRFDLGLTRAVADAVGIPVIASGGVGRLEHLAEGVLLGGADAVLAASIFHFGEFSVREAKQYMYSRGIEVRL